MLWNGKFLKIEGKNQSNNSFSNAYLNKSFSPPKNLAPVLATAFI
jgi:hypothetical protein